MATSPELKCVASAVAVVPLIVVGTRSNWVVLPGLVHRTAAREIPAGMANVTVTGVVKVVPSGPN